MKRRTDWRAIFNAALADATAKPFHRDSHNCALWAGGTIEAMTGEARLAVFRSTDYAGQIAALRAAGGLRAYCRSQLPEIAPAHAVRGDLALVDVSGTIAAGLFDPPYIWAVGPAGLVRQKTSVAVAAFKVG